MSSVTDKVKRSSVWLAERAGWLTFVDAELVANFLAKSSDGQKNAIKQNPIKPSPVAPTALPERYKRERILLAEAEQSIGESIRNAIEALPGSYEIFQAATAFEAFESMERNTPDLIFLDLDMPELDGFNLVRLLRSEHKETPVIVLTTFYDTVRTFEALQAGANGYLVRDANLAEVALDRASKAAQESHSTLVDQIARTREPLFRAMEAIAKLGAPLSVGEIEILHQVITGDSFSEIAATIRLTEGAVEGHVSSILGKLRVQSPAEAAAKVRELRIFG